jgi:excisionase family DNA binding protein
MQPTVDDPIAPIAYSVREARAFLNGISQATIYKLIRSGELRTVKVGGRRLVPRSALVELLDGGSGDERTTA